MGEGSFSSKCQIYIGVSGSIHFSSVHTCIIILLKTLTDFKTIIGQCDTGIAPPFDRDAAD